MPYAARMPPVKLDLPDELSTFLAGSGHNLERAALDAIALEAYRAAQALHGSTAAPAWVSHQNVGPCLPEGAWWFTSAAAPLTWSTIGMLAMPSRCRQPHDRHCGCHSGELSCADPTGRSASSPFRSGPNVSKRRSRKTWLLPSRTCFRHPRTRRDRCGPRKAISERWTPTQARKPGIIAIARNPLAPVLDRESGEPSVR